jgi:hypothetical protein
LLRIKNLEEEVYVLMVKLSKLEIQSETLYQILTGNVANSFGIEKSESIEKIEIFF